MLLPRGHGLRKGKEESGKGANTGGLWKDITCSMQKGKRQLGNGLASKRIGAPHDVVAALLVREVVGPPSGDSAKTHGWHVGGIRESAVQ